jgi:hypothetical protein
LSLNVTYSKIRLLTIKSIIMSLISDNIILGPNGRDFGTDAVEKKI